MRLSQRKPTTEWKPQNADPPPRRPKYALLSRLRDRTDLGQVQRGFQYAHAALVMLAQMEYTIEEDKKQSFAARLTRLMHAADELKEENPSISPRDFKRTAREYMQDVVMLTGISPAMEQRRLQEVVVVADLEPSDAPAPEELEAMILAPIDTLQSGRMAACEAAQAGKGNDSTSDK